MKKNKKKSYSLNMIRKLEEIFKIKEQPRFVSLNPWFNIIIVL